jgi:hypothetical protein
VDERGIGFERRERIEDGGQVLVLDLDQPGGALGGLGAVGGDGGDRGAVEARLRLENVAVVGADRAEHAGELERGGEVQGLHARARVRRAQHGGVQHPRELQVGGVVRLAPRPLVAVLPRCGPSDDGARPLRPLVDDVVAFDHHPLLGVVALDLLLGPDQPCHVNTASSIRG